MKDKEKTFKITCCYCKKPFHVRFPPINPEDKGKADVVVHCQYCLKDVVITIPVKYIDSSVLIRSINSQPV